MQLLIIRHKPPEDETLRTVALGKLYINGEFECFTEEPPMRDDNVFVAGESALPLGLYTVSLPRSPFYSRNVPLLVSSQLIGPYGTRLAIGMRILPGHYTLENYSVGVVVGRTQSNRNVHHTRMAFDQLVPKLAAAVLNKQAIELGIVMEET